MRRHSSASWNLDEIAAAFAGAAVDPSRWTSAMELVAQVTGGSGAALFPLRGKLPDLPHSRSLDSGFEAYVKDGWIHRDERYRAAPILKRKGVVSEFDFISADEINHSAYYQEFLAPLGQRWFAGVLLSAGQEEWCLSIHRSIEQGPFQSDELDRLAKLTTKLAGATSLASSLGFARIEAALSAFEVTHSAVVLIDRCAKVLRMNSAAEEILRSDPRIEQGRIISNDRRATAALDRALHDMLWTNKDRHGPGPVPLPRASKKPVLAYATRLAGVVSDALSACQGAVVLIDLERSHRPPEAALQAAFGLTPAEARLASRLATGDQLELIADQFGIAKDTARNQLKSVFEKTGAHRQSQLVALLASLLTQVM